MLILTRDERSPIFSSVSRVKLDELAKMIEGINFEDASKPKMDPKISNNLKSSLKSSPSNGQRKVQFTNRRKDEDFDFDLDDPLGDIDLSDCENNTKKESKNSCETKNNHSNTKVSTEKPSIAQNFKAKQNTAKTLSPLKVNDNSSNNIGKFSNLDSKSVSKMLPSDSPHITPIIPRRTSLQPSVKRNEDDLFSLDGKSSPRRDLSPARHGTRRNSSFMSDLFGHKKAESKLESKPEFLLDDKYKNAIASSTISENGSDGTPLGTPLKIEAKRVEHSEVTLTSNFGRRGRRGTAPTLNTQNEQSLPGTKRYVRKYCHIIKYYKWPILIFKFMLQSISET